MPIQRKYDFRAGTKISSDQVDEEFNQLINQINQIESDYTEKDLEFNQKAQLAKITSDNGDVSIIANLTTDNILNKILSKGRGLHTFYAIAGSKSLPPSNSSIRGVAQLTSPNFGWVWCIDYKNQMWTNYLDNNIWNGWKKLTNQTTEDGQEQLWSGVHYMHATQTVKPTKKLSECKTGWILVWSDFDYDVGANDYNWVFSYIPKNFVNYSGGGGAYFTMISSVDATEVRVTGKYLYIKDGEIVGAEHNDSAVTDARDVCLRYVYEF